VNAPGRTRTYDIRLRRAFRERSQRWPASESPVGKRFPAKPPKNTGLRRTRTMARFVTVSVTAIRVRRVARVWAEDHGRAQSRQRSNTGARGVGAWTHDRAIGLRGCLRAARMGRRVYSPAVGLHRIFSDGLLRRDSRAGLRLRRRVLGLGPLLRTVGQGASALSNWALLRPPGPLQNPSLALNTGKCHP
jgi:hypothetical protein